MVDKEHILSEIRRTAGENSGLPLGVDRFFSETGIKQHDWLGRYWARWGDALLEAGFEPNQLTAAYTDEFLYQKLVVLCRKLSHFPMRVEIQLARNVDPSFPTAKVFQRRGSKSSLAQKLAEYCHGRADLNDVVGMCERVAPRKHVARGVPPQDFGFVYLLKSGRFFKIGRTNALGRRERELAIQLPERAKLVHSIKTDDPEGIERYWHQRFAAQRTNGEWFLLEAEHIAAFRRRKFM